MFADVLSWAGLGTAHPKQRRENTDLDAERDSATNVRETEVLHLPGLHTLLRETARILSVTGLSVCNATKGGYCISLYYRVFCADRTEQTA